MIVLTVHLVYVDSNVKILSISCGQRHYREIGDEHIFM